MTSKDTKQFSGKVAVERFEAALRGARLAKQSPFKTIPKKKQAIDKTKEKGKS